jgi:predicted Zn-ribbon and HTH transcriptional regulator
MKDFFRRLFGEPKPPAPPDGDAVASAIEALDDGAAKLPLPTLVCRDCGRQYDNTGTYLRGSRCPHCYPGG